MARLTVEKVSTRLLGGQDVPPDLIHLIELGGRQSIDGDAFPRDALEATGFNLIDPDHLPPLLSHSYLNERDRTDPDIMANIRAFDEVFAQTAFVAVGDEDEIVGYWQGPDRDPLDKAPFVILDSEGQFSLLPGATITEAIVIYSLQARFDKAEVQPRFEEMSESLRAFGINLAIRDLAMVEVQPTRIDPAQVHSSAYVRFRTEAGLPPV
jgi:hypothetical protein